MKFSGVIVSPPSSCAERGPRTLPISSCLPLQVPENLVVPMMVKRTSSAILPRKPSAFPLDNSANMLRTISLFSAAPIISPLFNRTFLLNPDSDSHQEYLVYKRKVHGRL